MCEERFEPGLWQWVSEPRLLWPPGSVRVQTRLGRSSLFSASVWASVHERRKLQCSWSLRLSCRIPSMTIIAFPAHLALYIRMKARYKGLLNNLVFLCQGRSCEGGICEKPCLNKGKCIQKDTCQCRTGKFIYLILGLCFASLASLV